MAYETRGLHVVLCQQTKRYCSDWIVTPAFIQHFKEIAAFLKNIGHFLLRLIILVLLWYQDPSAFYAKETVQKM